MILQITNTCGMNYPHCMQRSSLEPQHMKMETVHKFLEMLLDIPAHSVGISGGEPLMHPKWYEITDLIAKNVDIPILITNGYWIGDNETESQVVELLKKYPRLNIQVTSIKRFYRDYDKIMAKVPAFKTLLKNNGLKHRLEVTTDGISLHKLGRACDHEECRKEAQSNTKGTTSCFAAAYAAMQCKTIQMAISQMEIRGKFCHPFIDWKGNIHWSESWLCPSFANVSWHPHEISKAAVKWKPCGKCAGYKKLLARTEEHYVIARQMLGIDKEQT